MKHQHRKSASAIRHERRTMRSANAREQQHPPSLCEHEHELHGGHHGHADSGVLVLNHNFEPLNICGVRRGMVLVLLDKAEVLRWSEATLISTGGTHEVPSVVRLHVNIRRPMPRLKLSRKAVLARDDYTCVYCGSKQTLTIDHVFPRHRGGETTWENMVCSCLKCNNKKGARTPQECGMRLPTALQATLCALHFVSALRFGDPPRRMA